MIAFVPVACCQNMTSDGMKHRSAVVRDSPIMTNCCRRVVSCLPW